MMNRVFFVWIRTLILMIEHRGATARTKLGDRSSTDFFVSISE